MRAQEARGEETLEEFTDFGDDEDPADGLPVSPHEVRDMRVDELRRGAQLHKAGWKPKPKDEPKKEEVKP